MPTYGADVEQLRHAAQQLNTGAGSLESSAKTLSSRVNSVNWIGPDGNRFRSQWSSELQPFITSAVDALRHASENLRRNATDQENASAAGSGSGGG